MTVPQSNNIKDVQSLNVNNNPSPPDSGNGGIEIVSGPAVPLMIAIRDLLELDMKLLAENAKMANDETAVQGLEGVEMAKFAEETASCQGAATWSSAVGTAVSAGCIVAQFGGDFAFTRGFTAEAEKVGEEIQPADALSELVKDKEGDLQPAAGGGTTAGPSRADSPAARKLADEFKRGDYTNFKPENKADNIAALKSMKGNGNELEEFRKSLETKLETLEKRRSSAYTQMQKRSGEVQMVGQLAQGAANAGGQFGQAHWTKEAGHPQAGQTVANTAQSMAAETGQRTRAQVDQYYNKVAELMQLLVRASSAYPQG